MVGCANASGKGLRRGAGGRPPAAALLLAAAALAFSAPLPARAQAPPAGAGTTIAEDTVWEGTVGVRGVVTVAPGATLLVLPGTTVLFGSPEGGDPEGARAGLVVNGTLVAQGTPERPVRFASAAGTPAPADWSGIAFEAAIERESVLRNCVVEHAEVGLRGTTSHVSAARVTLRGNGTGVAAGKEFALSLTDVDITGNGSGVACNQGSAMTVSGSRISGNREAGVFLVSGSSPRIVGNEITGNGRVGVSCYMGSSPQIEDNLISGNEVGVHVELQSRPQIVHNEIAGNGVGISVEKLAFPVVAGNRIARNATGVYCNYSGYPTVRGNSIVDNGKFAFVLGDNQSIEVEKMIPFRSQGRHFAAPQPEDALPPQSRKLTPFTAGAGGLVDARGNWWGEAAAAQMAAAGDKPDANISVIEDFFDKPQTFYNDEPHPRDRVAWHPPEATPPASAGRAPRQAPSGIAGKVVLGGQPVAGVLVHAYADAAGAFTGAGAAYSTPTPQDGTFWLPLPPGTWYLVAKAAAAPFPWRDPGEGGIFGYYGGNPVAIAAGERREASIQAVRRRAVSTEPGAGAGRAVLKGAVVGPKGAPVEGASVFVYADASRSFRGPDLFGPQGAVPGGTDDGGRFEAELPPGRWFVVAARHAGGESLGPLRPGDLFGWFDGNPVELAEGTTATIVVQAVEKLKDQQRQPAAGPAAAARVGIGGVIRDPAGAVPAGVYAYASTDPNLMTGSMPPYRSQPVGADGSYFIDLPGGSTYYVGARSGFGGPPLPGQWHGWHGPGKPEPVAVGKEGVVSGVDITVRRME